MAFVAVAILFGLAAWLLAPRANLGDLVVSVAANIGPFQKGLDQARSDAKGFAGDLSKAFSGSGLGAQFGGLSDLVGGLGGLAAGGSIGAAAVGAAKYAFDAADAYKAAKKEAEQFGFTINELATVRQLGGDRADELEKGVRHYQRTLNEAVFGNKQAQETFRALGIDWQRLATEAPIDQVRDLAERMKNAHGHTEQLRIATELLGRDGAKNIADLAKGAEGMEKAFEKATQHGKTMSSVTEAQLQNFTDGIKELQNLPTKLGMASATGGNLKAGFFGMLDAAGDIASGREIWASAQQRAQAMQQQRAQQQAKDAEATRAEIEAQQKKVTLLQQQAIQVEQNKQGAQQWQDAMGAFENLKMQTELLGKGADEAARMRLQFKGIKDENALNAVADAARKFEAAKFKDSLDPLSGINRRRGELQRMLDAGDIGQGQFAQGLAEAFSQLPGLNRQYRPLSAIEAGTGAAASYEARQRFEAEQDALKNDPQKRIEEIQRLQAAKLDKANDLLGKILDALPGFGQAGI